VKDALMKLEDAPSRIAPASSGIITIGIKLEKIGLNENFKEELQLKFQLKNSQRLLQQILSKIKVN
jgi:hypothetical protein